MLKFKVMAKPKTIGGRPVVKPPKPKKEAK